MSTPLKQTGPSSNLFQKAIHRLETADIPFSYFALTFLFAATLRNFFETYFNGEIASPSLAADLLHYYISYVCLAMALIILFHYATGETVAKIARVILPSFLILILPPILGLAVPSWRSFGIGYMFPGEHQDLLVRFFTFFGTLKDSGATPGMRIEIAIVIVASLIYFLTKKQGIIKSLVFTFLTYGVIFAYGTVPFLYGGFMKIFGITAELLLPPMTDFFFLLILIFGPWLYFLAHKTYAGEILRDFRLERILHYELMFVFGITLSEIAHKREFLLTQDSLFGLIFLMASILFSCLFSLATNNMADVDTDRVSNPQRPTVTMAIPAKHYRQLSWAFFTLAVTYASLVNFRSVFLILLFIGNYFLYSMPPVRLKRVPFFSKLLLSLNALVLILLGHIFHSGDFELPISVIVFFLIFITAAINFIDLKDYEGDLQAKIATLPTLLGIKKSKILIALFFIATYCTAPVFLNLHILFWPMLSLGMAQFALINRKNYSEKPVFALYLLSMAALIFLLRKVYLF